MEASQAILLRNRIIGVLIKQARDQTGRSQRECADFLGCSTFMFRKYEQGERGISLPELEALAYYFDVPVASLWDEAQGFVKEEPAESLPVEQLLLLRRKMLAIQFRQCRHAAGLSQREVAELLGCSASTISQYERARRDIPMAELEVVAEHCGQGLDSLLDDQTIPLSDAAREREILARLDELPADVRDFVLKPTNVLYCRIAILLSAMKADSLRQIAETLLDITY